ncbi:unnamed protein product [Lampetra fluviatilis]
MSPCLRVSAQAMLRGQLDVLQDWCYQAVSLPIRPSLSHLAMGKLMEQGPVLIITFQAQLVLVLRDSKGQTVEGDPDKVVRMLYVWALCRDQEELNPLAAWRLLDISASSSEQIL